MKPSPFLSSVLILVIAPALLAADYSNLPLGPTIHVNQSVVNGDTFEYVVSTENGGAVRTESGTTTIKDSSFTSVSSEKLGGAVYVADSANLLLQGNVLFSGNIQEAVEKNGAYTGTFNDVYLGVGAKMTVDNEAGTKVSLGSGVASKDSSASIIKKGKGVLELGAGADNSFYTGSVLVEGGSLHVNSDMTLQSLTVNSSVTATIGGCVVGAGSEGVNAISLEANDKTAFLSGVSLTATKLASVGKTPAVIHDAKVTVDSVGKNVSLSSLSLQNSTVNIYSNATLSSMSLDADSAFSVSGATATLGGSNTLTLAALESKQLDGITMAKDAALTVDFTDALWKSFKQNTASYTVTLTGLSVENNGVSFLVAERENAAAMEVTKWQDTAGGVVLTLGFIKGPEPAGANLTWLNAKKTVWQVGAGGWKLPSGTPADFANKDNVTIADGTVTISGPVAPGEVTISPTKSLTLKSDKKNPGSISGEASVTITGGAKAKVTMNEANSYKGGTTIKGATVTAKGNTSFGTGEITLSGGTLNLGSKVIENAITLSGSATIKSGKKYAGTFTMSGGELMKGSQLNLIKDATLSGGLINGTLSGTGELNVKGLVTLGDKAKLAANKLNITEDGTLKASAKGLAMNGKTSVVTVSGGDIVSAGKITAASLTAKDGASIRLENKTKAQSIALSGKGMTSALTGSTLYANGSMKVAGNLTLNHSTLTLVDVAKNKPMALNVSGNLSVGSDSSLTLSGALSAANLTLDNCTLNMTGAKLQTIKVKQALTFNSNIDLNLGFAVTQKDVDKGKAFKIFTFKSVKMSTSDLHELLGISD
ncbi:MAG: hypothetical protein IJB31_01870, partial [Akkermansia sp.]|nr:hypothetical protein [Akkermansia sp.]